MCVRATYVCAYIELPRAAQASDLSVCMFISLFSQGIVVKVLHQKLGERFYKKKGVVQSVKDMYTGVVKMLETGDVIKIDQAHLETVLPAYGAWE